MKMNDIVRAVSAIYRVKRNEIAVTKSRLRSVEEALFNAKQTDFKEITVARHNELLDEKRVLEQMINNMEQYCEGVSCVREYLMNLGFDTEVE